MAGISGKDFIPQSFQGYTPDIAGQIGLLWELIKGPLIVPLLKVCVVICLAMSVMVFVERLYMGVVIVLVKLFWKKPNKRYNWEPMTDDLEIGSATYPMVLVQIPMFNEKEVYKISIGAACNLSWPSDRLVIQVLDDSTDLVIKGHLESNEGDPELIVFIPAPELDLTELESPFSAAVPNPKEGRKGNMRGSTVKTEKVHLIELRMAYNCEIMLSKLKT